MKEKALNYIRTWNFMRVLRLVLGLIILVQGVAAAETLTILLGGVFAGMALANVGCSGSCPVNTIGSGGQNQAPAPGASGAEK